MLILISSLFLFSFGVFNLLGIKPSLVPTELIAVAVGLGLAVVIRAIGIHFFRLNAVFFYWVFVFLLIVTYIIGIEAKGSQRWIDLYFFNFQASEFFKPFYILFLADLLSKSRNQFHQRKTYLLAFFHFIIPTCIIFKQPDLGNALVYGYIFVVMVFFSQIHKKYILVSLFCLMLVIPFAWSHMHGYQKDRISSFFSPATESRTTAYNMTQAIITIGSGNVMGRGMGLGTQSHLYFLPENHTDFAFSSLVEQFGFIGGVGVLILFAFLFYALVRRILVYAARSDVDGTFLYLFTIGILSFFMIQAFVNMGMNMGILPIAGIALPFISYGGSMVLTIMIALTFVL
ncbi:rod shape-determining protein RodA [Candidatus Roizmanbacteria bacterium]|nr:rod shape-determining protein RodA [Candidatus Roizmanbacteria bacterium]